MKMDISRRKFLKSGLLIPVGVSVNPLLGDDSPSMNIREKMTHGPKIKISLNAFSFNTLLRKQLAGEPDGLSLFDLLDYCARIGFDAIDPTGYYFPGYPGRPDRSYISRFKREVHRHGLEISGTGIRTDFSNMDKTVREEGLALTREWVQVASDLGAPVLRVFVGNQPNNVDWKTAAGWAIDCLAQCAEYGRAAGVIVAIQNHAHMIKTADEAIYILNKVNSEYLGLVADTGSFLTSNPYSDIEKVIPYAVNWQLKDLLQSKQGGPIDVARFTRLLVKANYRGYVPIEALPGADDATFDPHGQVEKLYTAFRNAILAQSKANPYLL